MYYLSEVQNTVHKNKLELSDLFFLDFFSPAFYDTPMGRFRAEMY